MSLLLFLNLTALSEVRPINIRISKGESSGIVDVGEGSTVWLGTFEFVGFELVVGVWFGMRIGAGVTVPGLGEPSVGFG